MFENCDVLCASYKKPVVSAICSNSSCIIIKNRDSERDREMLWFALVNGETFLQLVILSGPLPQQR